MTWFVGLPIVVQILFVILTGLLAFALAWIGKVNLKFGKNIITFGRSSGRTCGDCILLILGKRERHDSQKAFIETRILKDQMNVVEQKLLEVQGSFLASYRSSLNKNRGSVTLSAEENKQYRLYQGILCMALSSVKDEVRRSLKENGFSEMGGAEFSNYVKNRTVSLIAVGHDHVLNLYPYEGMIVSMDERTINLEKVKPQLEDVCFDIFTKAKDIHLDAKKAMAKLDAEFSKEIDEFLMVKKS